MSIIRSLFLLLLPVLLLRLRGAELKVKPLAVPHTLLLELHSPLAFAGLKVALALAGGTLHLLFQHIKRRKVVSPDLFQIGFDVRWLHTF